jgi:hypothetical protein
LPLSYKTLRLEAQHESTRTSCVVDIRVQPVLWDASETKGTRCQMTMREAYEIQGKEQLQIVQHSG